MLSIATRPLFLLHRPPLPGSECLQQRNRSLKIGLARGNGLFRGVTEAKSKSKKINDPEKIRQVHSHHQQYSQAWAEPNYKH